jgi:hypothetical protein
LYGLLEGFLLDLRGRSNCAELGQVVSQLLVIQIQCPMTISVNVTIEASMNANANLSGSLAPSETVVSESPPLEPYPA